MLHEEVLQRLVDVVLYFVESWCNACSPSAFVWFMMFFFDALKEYSLRTEFFATARDTDCDLDISTHCGIEEIVMMRCYRWPQKLGVPIRVPNDATVTEYKEPPVRLDPWSLQPINFDDFLGARMCESLDMVYYEWNQLERIPSPIPLRNWHTESLSWEQCQKTRLSSVKELSLIHI